MTTHATPSLAVLAAMACAAGLLLVSPTARGANLDVLTTAGQVGADRTTVDFEGVSQGTPANDLYAAQGVQFRNVGAAPVPVYNWTALERVTSSPTNVIATASDVGGSVFSNYLDVLFTQDVHAVGAFFGNDQFGSDYTRLTLSLFDASDALLGSTFVEANQTIGIDQFIGLRSDAGFRRARFQNNSAGLSVALDDVTFSPTASVPEPGALYLLMAGMGVWGLKRRFGIGRGAARVKRRRLPARTGPAA